MDESENPWFGFALANLYDNFCFLAYQYVGLFLSASQHGQDSYLNYGEFSNISWAFADE